MGDNTEMGTLAVTEELHAKQQKAARGSRARGQEGAAGRGCGCEGRRGTCVQKGFGRPQQSSSWSRDLPIPLRPLPDRFKKKSTNICAPHNVCASRMIVFGLAGLTAGDPSHQGPSQALGVELVQQLLEGFLSCPAGHRHGLKIDRRLRYRACSPSAINLPPPRLRRGRPVLHDD
jgi:hypothetical protein